MLKLNTKLSPTSYRIGLAIAFSKCSLLILNSFNEVVIGRQVDLPSPFPSEEAITTIVNFLCTHMDKLPSSLRTQPVNISFMPEIVTTCNFIKGLSSDRLLHEVWSQIKAYQILVNSKPVMVSDMLWENKGMVAAVAAATDESNIKQLQRLMMRAQLRMGKIEPCMFSQIRGMAVAGILDTLVQQLPKKSTWATIGLQGNAEKQTCWVTLWQENMPLYVHTFKPPADNRVLERKILEYTTYSGYPHAKLWLTYQEEGCTSGLDLQSLNLHGSVMPCSLGRFLNSPDPQDIIDLQALGVSFIDHVDFPKPMDLSQAVGFAELPESIQFEESILATLKKDAVDEFILTS